MNRHISSILLFIIFCILFTRCNDSLPSDNDDQELRIELCIPPALEVETKAVSENDKLAVTISNVWVIQYDQNGAFKKIAYIDESDGSFADPSKKTMVVKTSGFEKVESRFYIIANAGQSGFLSADFSGPENDLKSKTLAITAGTISSPTFLTAGPIPLTQDSINKYEGKASIVAPLERAFAQVVVKWQNKTKEAGDTYAKGEITINKVEVCNLPKNMAAYSRGGSSDYTATYPVLDEIKTEITEISGGSLDVGSPRTFYMAENLRGTGRGTTFTEKNQPENGPGNTLNGCTYVRLTGTYAYLIPTPAGRTAPTYSSPIDVEYKLYLGGNLTNDYNVQRGYSYNLLVNISGANSADLRVTITNGNVAVFDEVQEITNKVDF